MGKSCLAKFMANGVNDVAFVITTSLGNCMSRISGTVVIGAVFLCTSAIVAQSQSSASPVGRGDSPGSATADGGATLGTGGSANGGPEAKPSNPTRRGNPPQEQPPTTQRPPGAIAPPVGTVPPNAPVLRQQ